MVGTAQPAEKLDSGPCAGWSHGRGLCRGTAVGREASGVPTGGGQGTSDCEGAAGENTPISAVHAPVNTHRSIQTMV